MTAMDKTYVYENLEVRLTGRRASKPNISATKPPIVLVEVTPANEYDGTWKKWVLPVVLFNIEE